MGKESRRASFVGRLSLSQRVLSRCNLLLSLQALSKRTQELESLKSEWSSHSASLTSQHSASLNSERERALQTQTQAQARFEQERRELEQAHLDRVREGGEMRMYLLVILVGWEVECFPACDGRVGDMKWPRVQKTQAY